MSMQCWVLILLLAVSWCGRAEAAGDVSFLGDGRMMEVLPDLLFDRSMPPPLPGAMLGKREELHIDDKAAQFVLPRPFDTSIGNNFTTQSCPNFFNEFLNNQTFLDCLPFSLLLQVGLLQDIHSHEASAD